MPIAAATTLVASAWSSRLFNLAVPRLSRLSGTPAAPTRAWAITGLLGDIGATVLDPLLVFSLAHLVEGVVAAQGTARLQHHAGVDLPVVVVFGGCHDVLGLVDRDDHGTVVIGNDDVSGDHQGAAN